MTEVDSQVVVAIDVSQHPAIWTNDLDSTYLALRVTDAEWKSEGKSHKIEFTWRESLLSVLRRSLSRGDRFRDFGELARDLNMRGAEATDAARDFFFSFCLDLPLHGCSNQRASDYCRRMVLLAGLVICFNPRRGLTGYLELVTGKGLPVEIQELGSNRTWRAHISEIVGEAEDFVSEAVTLSEKRNKRPGRPPLHLIPTTAPEVLLERFTHHPEDLVCGYCRFSEQ
ncbi:hypothetical protein EU546_05000 [Candidatus Thorarchaeota archaeon]|nr:MAG: hypothetical protein EU546_05000 [Candidatus Thorarchaeota archaeon]